MRRAAARLDLEPREPLVADADLQVGRLGDDRRVRAPLVDQRVGAEARVLLVHDRGDDETAGAKAALRALTRAASIIAATPPFMSCEPRPYSRPSRSTGSNGAAIPSTPTVSMWPQSISERSGRAALEHADDVRPPGRRLLHLHVETEPAQVAGDECRDARLPRAPGHE